MEALTRAPGTCGEWIQGWLDGDPVLVSCPVELYSTARVVLRQSFGVQALTPDISKAKQAVAAIVERSGIGMGVAVSIESSLPRSRGYASSTADIAAASVAAAQVCGVPMSGDELAQLACAIEPSDSTMFPDWTLFAYRSGSWQQPLGPAVRLPILILDPGGGLDTLTYNQNLDLDQVAVLEGHTRSALATFKEGIMQGDFRLLGSAARVSALAYQKVCYSSLVEQTLGWANSLDAGGPLRAHSGSIVGLLFGDDESAADARNWLSGRFDGEIHITHTTGGGVEVIECLVC
jgi:L-threonine kinase